MNDERQADDPRHRPAIWQGMTEDNFELALIGKFYLTRADGRASINLRLDAAGRREYDEAVARGWLLAGTPPSEAWYADVQFVLAVRAQLFGLPHVHVAGRRSSEAGPRCVAVDWSGVRGWQHLSAQGLARFEDAFASFGGGPYQASYGLLTSRTLVPWGGALEAALDQLVALSRDPSNYVAVAAARKGPARRPHEEMVAAK